jgi:acyl-CoA synthetase (AMP-forming)/AMP-acid ligase II
MLSKRLAMSVWARLKYFLAMRDFRSVADEIYKNFPFFYLSPREFRDRCWILQCCGAGIVLGYGKENFDVRIIQVSEKNDLGRSYEMLPLGHFGEIVFKNSGSPAFTHTGLYGFMDQQARIWCCGKIADTVVFNGKKYFPHCIEPLFEQLWWVKQAKLGSLKRESNIELAITIFPRKFLYPFIKVFEKFFLTKLENFSKKFKITSNIKSFSIEKNTG